MTLQLQRAQRVIGLVGFGLLGQLASCSKQFEFDVLVAGAGNSSVGAAATSAATSPSGGTTSGGTTSSGATGAGGTSAQSSTTAVDTSPTYPNLAECTHHCATHAVVCAKEWLKCAECNADSDCTQVSRRRCDAITHRCFECGVDQDCATGSVCDKDSRRCVVACDKDATESEGSDDVSCPTGTSCDESISRCVCCATNSDCAGSSQGHYCQPTMRSCVGCLSDSACSGTTPYCDPVEFKCVVCRDSRDCGDDRCNPATHQCE